MLLAVGGFDPLFFLYVEDNDLCHRVRKGGWKLGVVPASVVLHWHGLVSRPKRFRWRVNFSYGEAVAAVKAHPHPVTGVALAAVAYRWFLDPRWVRPWLSRTAARLVGFARCAARVRQIDRARRAVPFAFTVPADGPAGPAADAKGVPS